MCVCLFVDSSSGQTNRSPVILSTPNRFHYTFGKLYLHPEMCWNGKVNTKSIQPSPSQQQQQRYKNTQHALYWLYDIHGEREWHKRQRDLYAYVKWMWQRLFKSELNNPKLGIFTRWPLCNTGKKEIWYYIELVSISVCISSWEGTNNASIASVYMEINCCVEATGHVCVCVWMPQIKLEMCLFMGMKWTRDIELHNKIFNYLVWITHHIMMGFTIMLLIVFEVETIEWPNGRWALWLWLRIPGLRPSAHLYKMHTHHKEYFHFNIEFDLDPTRAGSPTYLHIPNFVTSTTVDT